MSPQRHLKNSRKARGKSKFDNSLALPASYPSHSLVPTANYPNSKTPDNLTPNSLDVAWNKLEATLWLLERTADAFPPLKSAVSGLVALQDLGEAVTKNDEEYTRLATKFTSIAENLTQYGPALTPKNIRGSTARIVKLINMESTRIKQLRDRNKISQPIAANQDQRGVIEHFHRIESLFHQLQSEMTLRSQTVTVDRYLFPVYGAQYKSDYYPTTIYRRGCTAGTCEKVLEDLKAWVGNPRGAKIYWMNGTMGTGKTAISYTLCEWLKKNNQLGANYFCSRASDLCSNVNRIMPTLAHQLAEYSHVFRSMLYKTLGEEPGAHTRDVDQQFERFLQSPLQAMKAEMPDNVVIVIDALDECKDGVTFDLFLDTLLKSAVDLPIKFFITSRPEPTIHDKILASEHSHSVLYFDYIEGSIVGADIKKYLNKTLESMSPVPSPADIERLTERAGKLFIYAETAVRYISPGDPNVNCRARLQTVLETAPGSTDDWEYGHLDSLYRHILHTVLYPHNHPREEEEKNHILLVLKTIVCAKEPMTTKTLASLLSLTEKQVRFLLQPLRSVLHIRENVEKPIVLLHTSFQDFLLDKSRSKEFHCEGSAYIEVPSSGIAGTPIALLKLKDIDGKYIDIPVYEPLHWQKFCNFLVKKQIQAKQYLSSGDCVVYTPDGRVLFDQKWDNWISLAIFFRRDDTPLQLQVELRVVRKYCCEKLSEQDQDICNNCGTPLYDVDIPPPSNLPADPINEDIRSNHITPPFDMDSIPPASPPADTMEFVPSIPVTNTPHIEIPQPLTNIIHDGSHTITTSIDITYTSENSVVRRRKWQSSSEKSPEEQKIVSFLQEGVETGTTAADEGQNVDSQNNTLRRVVHGLLTFYLYLINPPFITLPFTLDDTIFHEENLDFYLSFLQSWILGIDICLFGGAWAVLAMTNASENPILQTFMQLSASFALFGIVFGILLTYNIGMMRGPFVQWATQNRNRESESRVSVWNPIIMLNLPLTWSGWAIVNTVIFILFYATLWTSDPSSNLRIAKIITTSSTGFVIWWSLLYVYMIQREISRFKLSISPQEDVRL